MLRDNLVELIEPMLNSAGVHPSRAEHSQPVTASDDRFPCLENPRPKGAESSLRKTSLLHFRLSQHTSSCWVHHKERLPKSTLPPPKTFPIFIAVPSVEDQ